MDRNVMAENDGGIMTPVAEIMIGTMPVTLKLEEYNASGSHKDRFAWIIVRHLRETGVRQAVMLSSGNAAIGVAHHTQDEKIELTIITDTLSPREFRQKLLSYHHVRLEVVNQPDANGSHMEARYALRDTFLASNRWAVEIDQYGDRRIPLAYEKTLFREIDLQLYGDVGAVVVPTGTGGLLNGLLKYKLKNNRRWEVIAADAYGSRLFWQPPAGTKRCHSGYGNGRPTALVREVCAAPYCYRVVHVSDEHAVAVCHRLRRRDKLLLGPSGGATIAAVELILRHCPNMIPDFGRVVAVMPDSGRSYLSTVYSDAWLIANGFGKVVSTHI
jgi:cysteine synthase